ncbi:2Fe-2S iron-sulfur cluster-binding protein [Leucobacter sp. BZR 635]
MRIQGQEHEVPSGQSVLAASLTLGTDSAPEALCGMGSCYACVVTRNGSEQVRACVTQVREGDSYDW